MICCSISRKSFKLQKGFQEFDDVDDLKVFMKSILSKNQRFDHIFRWFHLSFNDQIGFPKKGGALLLSKKKLQSVDLGIITKSSRFLC